MYYNRKKQLIKSACVIIFILLIAVLSTHYIYYKFQNEREIDYTSASLNIVFHEKSGEKVTLTKITPVTDSVGLSSKAYTFTVKNNLTVKTKYTIKLIDDIEKVESDNCEQMQIGKDMIKVSIKEGKQDNKIYMLNELPENILIEETIKPLEEKEYTVRVWTVSTANQTNDIHYHGKLQIIEDGNVAVAR